MSSASELEKEFADLLDTAAKELNLSNYTKNLNLDLLRGDGYMGEFYKAALIDTDKKQETKVVLKKAPRGATQRKNGSIPDIYHNEIYFYSTVIPTLQAFEKERDQSAPFDSVADYITNVGDEGKEVLVLKDITADGFELREKKLLLDDEHASYVFKTYGHFHGLSFCFKDQQPEEFSKIVQPLIPVLLNSAETSPGFIQFFAAIAKQALDALDPEADAAIIHKLEKYVSNMKDLFIQSVKYEGRYACILHGDCWSNNMMFRYKNGRLDAIKLLDFQLVNFGTPINDLSYFFYAGGSRDLFKNLEHYLDLYHESFSQTCRKLGSDPDVLFPRDALSKEWKQYSKMGLLMSLLLVKLKLVSKEDSIKVIDEADEVTDVKESPFLKIKCNEEEVNKRIYDILEHVNEIEAL